MWPNPHFTAYLVPFTEEILTENFIFCAVMLGKQLLALENNKGQKHVLFIQSYNATINPFDMPLISFNPSWKDQKTSAFLDFQEV